MEHLGVRIGDVSQMIKKKKYLQPSVYQKQK
jgi:hypothetical protein